MKHFPLPAMLLVATLTDGALFLSWVKQGLVPGLQRDDVVIMDNLATHKVAGVREAIVAAGARLEYPPPYSPYSPFTTARRCSTLPALISAPRACPTPPRS